MTFLRITLRIAATGFLIGVIGQLLGVPRWLLATCACAVGWLLSAKVEPND